jgi:hypothetical protein
MMCLHRSTRVKLSRPLPALTFLSTVNHEAQPAGATYRLGAQEFTVSAAEPADRPETLMDAGFCARNLPSNKKLA